MRENHRLWESREGLVPASTLPMRDAVRAFVRSVPTMSHARQLFDAVGEALGERGYADPSGGPANLRWYAREEDGWYRRQPLIQHGIGVDQINAEIHAEVPIEGVVYPSDAPEGWSGHPFTWRQEDPDPDIIPAGLPNGTLALYEGNSWIEVRYDKRGVARRDQTGLSSTDVWTRRRHDAVRPFMVDPLQRPRGRHPVSLLGRADLDPAGHSIEELARMVLDQDAARDLVRVWMPELAPGGIEGTWWRALYQLRRLFWNQQIPSDARRVVIDSFDHSAVAWGATLEEAAARWEREVWRHKPKPPADPEIPSDWPEETTVETEGEKTVDPETGHTVLPKMTAHIVMRPPVDIPWPKAIPENVPSATIAIPAMPADIPAAWRERGFTHWRRLLGEHGDVSHVLVRQDTEADFTFVGEGILDAVDPETLDAQIEAETERARAEWPRTFGDPPWVRLEYPYEKLSFSAWDQPRRAPAPLKCLGQSWGEKLEPHGMDGDHLRWLVTRMRALTR